MATAAPTAVATSSPVGNRLVATWAIGLLSTSYGVTGSGADPELWAPTTLIWWLPGDHLKSFLRMVVNPPGASSDSIAVDPLCPGTKLILSPAQGPVIAIVTPTSPSRCPLPVAALML